MPSTLRSPVGHARGSGAFKRRLRVATSASIGDLPWVRAVKVCPLKNPWAVLSSLICCSFVLILYQRPRAVSSVVVHRLPVRIVRAGVPAPRALVGVGFG